MELPAPRTPGRYRVAVVCLGNICRSPMAHVVLEARVAEAGLADRVEVVSSGTAGWHVGKPMDPRAAATLSAAGYDPSRHRARQFDAGWFADVDLVLVMDAANRSDVLALAERPEQPGQVAMFRDFDPDDPGADVPDPYYGGDDGFQEVLAMVERSTSRLVALLAEQLADQALEQGGPSGG